MSPRLMAILAKKPSKELILQSLKTEKDSWNRICESQRQIVIQQQHKNNNLVPQNELYKTPFSL